jgi:hypothetical protein
MATFPQVLSTFSTAAFVNPTLSMKKCGIIGLPFDLNVFLRDVHDNNISTDKLYQDWTSLKIPVDRLNINNPYWESYINKVILDDIKSCQYFPKNISLKLKELVVFNTESNSFSTTERSVVFKKTVDDWIANSMSLGKLFIILPSVNPIKGLHMFVTFKENGNNIIVGNMGTGDELKIFYSSTDCFELDAIKTTDVCTGYQPILTYDIQYDTPNVIAPNISIPRRFFMNSFRDEKKQFINRWKLTCPYEPMVMVFDIYNNGYNFKEWILVNELNDDCVVKSYDVYIVGGLGYTVPHFKATKFIQKGGVPYTIPPNFDLMYALTRGNFGLMRYYRKKFIDMISQNTSQPIVLTIHFFWLKNIYNIEAPIVQRSFA